MLKVYKNKTSIDPSHEISNPVEGIEFDGALIAHAYAGNSVSSYGGENHSLTGHGIQTFARRKVNKAKPPKPASIRVPGSGVGVP